MRRARLRRLEELLAHGDESLRHERVGLAQAVSRARRLVRHEDRTRAPSTEFRARVERAELLAAASRAGHVAARRSQLDFPLRNELQGLPSIRSWMESARRSFPHENKRRNEFESKWLLVP